MAIRFSCEVCGKSLKADDSKAGKRFTCPGCAEVITVPHSEDTTGSDAGYSAQEQEDENPFRAPKSDDPEASRHKHGAKDYKLADPGRRFVGAFLDNIVGMVFCLPAIGTMVFTGIGSGDPQETYPDLPFEGIVLLLLGLMAWAVTNIYLLATRSQSVAKYLLRMQVIDYQTNEPASFAKCAVLRSFVNGLIGAVPYVGTLYSIVDALFIFGGEHRCLHDHLAGTYVVDLR